MGKQITEEFARIILCGTVNAERIDNVVNEWKEKGYIKQSREDEIKEN